MTISFGGSRRAGLVAGQRARAGRRPSGRPGPAPVRVALRDMIEALMDSRPGPTRRCPTSTTSCGRRGRSTRSELTATGLRARTRWHRENDGSAAGIHRHASGRFLSDPSQESRLRRCANPACLMIFIAVIPRRSWCVPGVCGNPYESRGIIAERSKPDAPMRDSGRPRRFKSADEPPNRSSCGAATMATTSRSSGGSSDLMVRPAWG